MAQTYNTSRKLPWPTLAEIEAAIAELEDARLNEKLAEAHRQFNAAVLRFGLKATFRMGGVDLSGSEAALAAFKAWVDEQQDP